jgi:hypothetical protein
MNHKVGDTVRIQSREWIERQDRTHNGFITYAGACYNMSEPMLRYAGKMGKIKYHFDEYYHLDIDNGMFPWEDWMFDSDYRPNEPLTPEDAIRAMLDGETLYNENRYKCYYDSSLGLFACEEEHDSYIFNFKKTVFYRRPEKRKREMNRWEILAWVMSEESRGWVVRQIGEIEWKLPHYFAYDLDADRYERSKLLPDSSGIDESTIQGFEIAE